MITKIEVEDSRIAVPGGVLFVRKWMPQGDVHQTPLVLLHDSLGSVELWRDFPSRLADLLNRPVLAYDRLGFGHSSARDELPSSDFIQAEAEIYFPILKDSLKLLDYFLFGFSVGGSMALSIAARDDRCLAVVSESSQIFVEPRTLEGIERAKKSFNDPAQLHKLQKWHGDKASWVLRAWTEVWTAPTFAEWSLIHDLPKVKCPVLAIHGDQDEFGTIAFPEAICKHVSGPCKKVVLQDCGHVPHREYESDVLNLVSDFLRDLS